MRSLIILAALVFGLSAMPAYAGQNQIKLVPTVIGITVTDLAGQQLFSPDSLIIVLWDQFGKKPWPEEYWAPMIVDTQSTHTLISTRFPVDQNGIRYLWLYSKFFHKPRIMIGYHVLDGHRQPLKSANGVRIVLWQLGPDPWPQELWVTIEGQLDERGHILAPTNFPLTSLVVKNLTMLAQDQKR